MYDDGYEIKERNLVWAVAFSFVTMGIYSLYWLYKLQKDTTRLMGLRNETSPALVVVFSILTLGIYTVYWAWKMGVRFRDEAQSRGSNEADDCPSLYLVLQLFNYLIGVTYIVNQCLMQDRLNQLLRMRGMGTRPYDPERFHHVSERDIMRQYRARAEAYEAEAAADEDLQDALETADGKRALYLSDGDEPQDASEAAGGKRASALSDDDQPQDVSESTDD